MISTMMRYQMLQTNPTLTKSITQNDAMVKRDTEYYQANISKVKTIDEFVKDYRLFSYAMKAYGLEDMIYAKAFIKKVLTEGVTSSTSMANKMTDPRYKEFAKAFDFAAKGDKATSEASATTEAVSKYYQQTLENKEGEQNEGVRLALYFKRKASGVTSTMGLLADKGLLKVMQTTFSIPAEASKADLDLQVRNLEKHINIKDLQDPKKVDKLIQRFNAMWDVTNPSMATTAPVLTLFDQSSPQQGFSVDLMMSIAKLRPGGF
jgi:hypothetical protein